MGGTPTLIDCLHGLVRVLLREPHFPRRGGGDDGANTLALWKRRGKRAFDAEAEEAASSDDPPGGED